MTACRGREGEASLVVPPLVPTGLSCGLGPEGGSAGSDTGLALTHSFHLQWALQGPKGAHGRVAGKAFCTSGRWAQVLTALSSP